MLKVLLLLLCLIKGNDYFFLDRLNYESRALYSIKVPKGENNVFTHYTSDMGGQGKIRIYEFQSGAVLYISNDESLCPTLNKDNYCLTGDVINRDAFPDDYQLEYQGFMEGSGYYWERQTFDVCYGYYGVSDKERELFNPWLEVSKNF